MTTVPQIPVVPAKYDPNPFQRAFAVLQREIAQMRRRNVDIELGPDERLILTTSTGARRQIVLHDDGTITTVETASA
jgi:hypothetical protein